MKKLAIALAVLLTLVSFTPAMADSASHKKAAASLLDTMNMSELLSQSIEAMLQLEIKNNPQLRPFEGTMRTFFQKYMSGESLRDDFIDIYTAAFTEKELLEIQSFYQTPTGQKALKVTPRLMAQGATLGQQRVKQNLPELERMVREEAERLKKNQQK